MDKIGMMNDILSIRNLNMTCRVNFSGVIVEKLPNTEFIVRLTHFCDGTPVPSVNKVLVNARVTGKIRDRKIKIAVHDTVTVAISMESAKSMQGAITYRDRGKPRV